jgi:deoxycytidylate deaminase
MANKIQIRRGLKTNLPSLDVGEPALCTDTKEVFVGNSGGNVALINKEVMDEHLKNYTLQVPYAQAAGSANTYTVTLNPPLTGYTEGVAVAVKIDASNTGASTININGRGAKSIRDPRGNALKAGKLTAGSIYTLRYNGTNFILQGEGSTGNALASDLLSGKTASTDAGDITGTMPSNGSQTATLTTQGASKVVPAGYTSGGTITASFSNLSAGNVKSGVNVGGVTGTYAPLAGYMWTQRTSGFTRNIEAIAYGQGMFVIADFDSKLATSTDGINWTQRTSGIGVILSIAYGQGMFVAVEIGGKLITSTDGINWTQRTSSFDTTHISGAITYGQGMFVAVGYNGKLATSTDGINWTQRISGFDTSNIEAAAYGQGMFVVAGASGKLATSTDGINWTQRTSSFGTSTITGIIYDQGNFVAVGYSGKLATSTDGINWTQRTSSFGTTPILSIACGQGMFVAAGNNGKLATSQNIYVP